MPPTFWVPMEMEGWKVGVGGGGEGLGAGGGEGGLGGGGWWSIAGRRGGMLLYWFSLTVKRCSGLFLVYLKFLFLPFEDFFYIHLFILGGGGGGRCFRIELCSGFVTKQIR